MPQPVLFMTFVAKSPESPFPMKRISYHACDDTDTLFPSCVSRFTRKSSESAVTAEALMNNAG